MLTRQEQVFLEITKRRDRGIYLPLDVLNGENQKLRDLANFFFDELRTIVGLFDKSCNLPKTNFFIGLIDCESVGAFAAEVENCMYVGINKGTFLIFYNIFQIYMSFPEINKNIGDFSKEFCQKLFDKIPSKASDFKKNVNPNDSERTDYGHKLYFLSMLCIALHEVNHIKRGHLEIKKHLASDDFFSIQALELDADLSSTHMIISWLVQVNKNKNLINPKYSKYLNNLSISPEMFLTSVHVILYLDYVDYTWADNYKNKEHPPAALRVIAISEIIRNLLNLENETQGNVFYLVFPLVIQEVKNFFELLTNKNTRYEPRDQYNALISKNSDNYYYLEITSLRKNLMDKYKDLSLYPDPISS